MEVVDKKILAAKIYKRFGGALPKLVIQDAIQAICGDVYSKLANQESISVDGFGTLHVCRYDGHNARDISSGQVRMTQPFLTIRFVPHKNFSDLIDQKKQFFTEK